MMQSPTSMPKSPDVRRLGLPDLAFVGKAGSGKTTAARALIQFEYAQLSFAYPLKMVAKDLWGSTAQKDRRLLQGLGQTIRDLEPDTLVDLLLARITDARNTLGGPRRPIAIDDCRYENEWHELKAEGFVIVRLTADLPTRIQRLKQIGKWHDPSQLSHTSETSLDRLVPDYTIANEGSIDELMELLLPVLLKEQRKA